ncbi:hypothetical protein C0J52_20335 [Blattella germanica]|nr:hypothetical protein C0J52_20335 [Blattella germanica]
MYVLRLNIQNQYFHNCGNSKLSTLKAVVIVKSSISTLGIHIIQTVVVDIFVNLYYWTLTSTLQIIKKHVFLIMQTYFQTNLQRIFIDSNCSKQMPRPDDSLWGVDLGNGTWSGITGEVVRGYADIATANIWHKMSHITDTVKWFVPCAQPYPRWTSITRVFKASLWLGFLAAFIIVSFIMYLVVVASDRLSLEKLENQAYHGVVKVVLHFWAVILEESASNKPPHVLSIRSVFIAWLLYFWAVKTVYQTFLTTFLVDPGLQHQISSEDELLTSATVRYGFDSDTVAVISGLVEDRYRHRVIFSTLQDCRVRFVTTNKFTFAFGAVTTEYQIAARFMDGDGNSRICHFDDVIANQLTSMTVRKGYPLLEHFNKVIRLEAGLVEKWFKDFKYTATLNSAKEFNFPPGEYIKLSMEHLQSAFYFLYLDSF